MPKTPLLVDRVPEAFWPEAFGSAATVLEHPDRQAVRVRLDWPAPTLAQAVAAGVRAAESAGVAVLRVDADDWVTVEDVAVRVGRSRETVRLWAAGRMGPGGFPAPANPRRGTVFYSWVAVLWWLRHRMGSDLPEENPALVVADQVVRLRALLSRVPCSRALVELLAEPTGPTTRAR